jgi:hypothetical protein
MMYRFTVFNPPYLESEYAIPPIALLEGGEIVLKYFYPSSTPIQIEMEKALLALDSKITATLGTSAGASKNYGSRLPSKNRLLRRTRQLYEQLFPSLSVQITMLVRLLFYLNVSSSATVADNGDSAINLNSLSPAEKVKELTRRDGSRHKEIITKSISLLLLTIVKVAKRYRRIYWITLDALAFEHVCILLVDNNAPILILKMLSSWYCILILCQVCESSSSKGKKSTG